MLQSDDLIANRIRLMAIIRPILDRLFPHTPPPLDSSDAFTLLVAVLLSAQCTDDRVNSVTPALFSKASTPNAMVDLGPEEIEVLIRPCGLSKTKSKAIWELSRMLLELHGGKVPDSMEALQRLPGVGRKTASVVMVQAFGQPAFPVDTHIIRLAMRWGLSESKDPLEVEVDLCSLVPQRDWGHFHLQMIYYGRKYCKAKGHISANCPVCTEINV